MCGIAGFWGGEDAHRGERSLSIIRCMTDAVLSRGPDSQGHWQDSSNGVVIGHRRLSIQDLSDAGAQPMQSRTGRFAIVYNGEIYNHLDIRRALESDSVIDWRGHSDTETLLAAIEAWGIEQTLRRCVGMFAFAIWDSETRTLSLARDRAGEKPLYFGWHGSGSLRTLLFGSQLSALRCHPRFDREISRSALAAYMKSGVIPGNCSIYVGVFKVPPGKILKFHNHINQPSAISYWSANDVAESCRANRFQGSDVDAVEALHDVLGRSVRQQMLSDVPLGAFLSGGIDSSLVVALMKECAPTDGVRTFTIGLESQQYNEATSARSVADHLQTRHFEHYVTASEALGVISRLPFLYDEPFADSSQIPTALVSQITRRFVTVALSGDAADELFAGYNRHQIIADVWPSLRSIPSFLRRAAGWPIQKLSPAGVARLAHLLALDRRWSNPADKLRKMSVLLGSRSVAELYARMTTTWPPQDLIVIGQELPKERPLGHHENMSELELVMHADFTCYLPDDILTKVDRAGMGCSLETRIPFLDHRVVEFAWSLPEHFKVRKERGRLVTKWILRQLLHRYVPTSLVDRPKSGFGVPIEDWLRGPLRQWAESLLEEAKLRREGFLDPAIVRKRWMEHLSGRHNWHERLWAVLMFQAWLEQNPA